MPPAQTSATCPALLPRPAATSTSQNPGPIASATGASSTPTKPAQPHPETCATILEGQELIWERETGPLGPVVLEAGLLDLLLQSVDQVAMGATLQPTSGVFLGSGLERKQDPRLEPAPYFYLNLWSEIFLLLFFRKLLSAIIINFQKTNLNKYCPSILNVTSFSNISYCINCE